MPSSNNNKIIVDSIHNDIHLTDLEWKIIDTPSFQRLRNIKQLQMSHLTYPNATHTRFAHSIGTLAIMKRVLKENSDELELDAEMDENLRLASLLHDIGHYPYSHLVERMWQAKLTEDYLSAPGQISSKELRYPEHIVTGEMVVRNQKDILNAIGNETRAKKIADIFTGSDPNLSSLITSSFDLDRMDYLLRDSYATGVPYGEIDINYLLNSIKINNEKLICVSEKSIPAAEQFLMARFFMHRTVYFHKTTCGMEEMCRQLLRRLLDSKKYPEIPNGQTSIEAIFKTTEFLKFTDAFIDQVIQKAVEHHGNTDSDKVIKILAQSIVSRRPPKLLREIAFWHDGQNKNHDGRAFRRNFTDNISQLVQKYKLLLGQFIFCEKVIQVEKDEDRITVSDIKKISDQKIQKEEHIHREIIKIFRGKDKEPQSLMDREESIIKKFSGQSFHLYRLYVAFGADYEPTKVKTLKEEIKDWHNI